MRYSLEEIKDLNNFLNDRIKRINNVALMQDSDFMRMTHVLYMYLWACENHGFRKMVRNDFDFTRDKKLATLFYRALCIWKYEDLPLHLGETRVLPVIEWRLNLGK